MILKGCHTNLNNNAKIKKLGKDFLYPLNNFTSYEKKVACIIQARVNSKRFRQNINASIKQVCITISTRKTQKLKE